MQVMLITGSIAEKSHTRVLAQELETALKERGVTTQHWDLRTEPLPIADPDFHHEPENHPDQVVRRFIGIAREADGFVLASPLYHGSFSGVLKNALDHLWYDAFRNKPVALMSHGANERRCSNPCVALQPVVATLFGYSAQTQVSSANTDYSHDAEGRPSLSNQDIKARVVRQADELVRLMKNLAKE